MAEFAVRRRAAALLLVLSALAGCASPEKGLLGEIQDAGLNAHELEARIEEFSFRVLNRTERQCALIYFDADSTTVERRNAVRWILWTNQEIVRATSHDDPVVIAVDLWVLSEQVYQFFSAGDGADWFGPYQDQVVTTCAELRDTMLGYIDELTPAVPGVPREGRVAVEEFIAANPIDGTTLFRASSLPVIARWLPKRRDDFVHAVSSLDVQVGRVAGRIDVLTILLPKQLLWGSAFLIDRKFELFEERPFAQRISEGLEHIDEIPAFVEEQRDAVFAAVDEQRIAVLAEVDAQREKIFESIDVERETILREVDGQREAITASVNETLDRTLAEVNRLHDQTFVRIDETVETATGDIMADVDDRLDVVMADVTVRGDAITDRAFRAALIVVGVAFLGGLILLLVAAKLRPR